MLVHVISGNLRLLKGKFLVHRDQQFSEVQAIVRKYLTPTLAPEKGLIYFIKDGTGVPPGSWLMSRIDHEFASKDGFVYVGVRCEDTFG